MFKNAVRYRHRKVQLYPAAVDHAERLFNLGPTCGFGQLNVVLGGNSIFQMANNGTDYANWTLGANITKDSTGMLFSGSGTTSDATLPIVLIPSTQYTIIFDVVSTNLTASDTKFALKTNSIVSANINLGILCQTVGKKKVLLTTGSTITNSIIRIGTTGNTPVGENIKIANIMVVVGDQTANPLTSYYMKYGSNSTLSGVVRVHNNLGFTVASQGAVGSDYYVGRSLSDLVVGSKYRISNALTQTTAFKVATAYGASDTNPALTAFNTGWGAKTYEFTYTQAMKDAGMKLFVFVQGTTSLNFDVNKLALGDSKTEAYYDGVYRKVGDKYDEVNIGTGEDKQNVSDPATLLNGDLAWQGLTTNANTYRMEVRNLNLTNYIQFTAGAGYGYCADGGFSVLGSTAAIDAARGIALAYGYVYLSVEKAKVDAMTGADATAKFKAYLNANPVTLFYQLKDIIQTQKDCPIITNGKKDDILRTFGPNTTVDISFVDWKEAIPDGSNQITLTGSGALASLDKVMRQDIAADGKIIYTDVTGCSLDTATRKVTIPSPVAGKKYFAVALLKDGESANPTTRETHIVNPAVTTPKKTILGDTSNGRIFIQ